MIAHIQLQHIFPYTILANTEVKLHAPNTYQQNRGIHIKAMSNKAILVAATFWDE